MKRFVPLLLFGLCGGCTGRLEPPPSALPPPVPPPPRITLVGVGDILLGRKLGVEMEKTGDYSLPFQKIAPLLTTADLTFGNLEGTFCEKPPWTKTGMIFRLRPEAVKALKLGGFDVVSVANNHFGDGGEACIRFSLGHLRAHGIAAAGAGTDFKAAHTAAIIKRKGVRFAFLGYTYASLRDEEPPVGRTPGAKARCVIAGRNAEQVRRDVKEARKKAEVVIVSLHDGAEYLQRVAQETEEFAHAAIEAGAVAVLGHHPHVPQRVEPYKDGWIFYSLGNFVFQQNTPAAVRHSLIARLTFTGKSLTQVEAIPAVIETYSRPRLATVEEAARVLKSAGIESPAVWKVEGPAPPRPLFSQLHSQPSGFLRSSAHPGPHLPGPPLPSSHPPSPGEEGD